MGVKGLWGAPAPHYCFLMHLACVTLIGSHSTTACLELLSAVGRRIPVESLEGKVVAVGSRPPICPGRAALLIVFVLFQMRRSGSSSSSKRCAMKEATSSRMHTS